MATLEELVIELVAETKQFNAQMAESAKVTSDAAKNMESSISKMSSEGSKSTSKFSDVMTVFAGNVMANVATKAFEMVGAAVGSFVANFQEGIAASIAQETAMTKLANAMQLSGQWTAKSADEMGAFADEMERTTGIEDDVIASNLAMLSSLTRLSGEGLQQAQKAALDLSAAMGISLETATKMVGKAAEGNVDSFKKFGVELETGSTKAETFAMTMATLNSRFGGAAAGAMQTFAGALKGATNNFGNFFEAIADTVVHNEVVIAIIKEVAKVLGEMTSFVQANAGAWKKDLAGAIVTVAETLTIFAQIANLALTPIARGVTAITLSLQALIDGFQAAAVLIKGGSFSEAGAQFAESSQKMDDFAASINAGTGPLDGLVQTMARVTGVAQDAFGTMDASIKTVTPTIKTAGVAVDELTWKQQALRDAAKSFAEGLATDSLSVESSYGMQTEALNTQFLNQTMSFEAYKAATLASQADLFAQQTAMLELAKTNNLVSDEQYYAAKTQLQQKQALESQKIMADLTKKELADQQLRLSQTAQFFSGFASLSQSGNKELAGIGKAAAIAQATVSGYAAVQNALAVPPYPVGVALAISAGVQAASNIAKIAGVGLKSGIDSVPGIGSSDNFPAMLAPGERVTDANTNQDLKEFLARENSNGGRKIEFNLNLTIAPGTGISNEQAANIVQGINDYVSAGGLRIQTA